MFNKYEWLTRKEEALKEHISWEVRHGNEVDTDQLREQLDIEINNSVIYYHECFDIIKSCGFTDWSDHDLRPITNVSQAAAAALCDFCDEELDLEELLVEALEEIENESN
jgi:hypothetical protein